MTKLLRIPPEEFESVLHHVRPWLEKVRRFPAASWDAQGLAELAATGEADLWTIWEDDFSACLAAALTQRLVLENGGVRCLVLWLGGRSMKRWRQHIDEVGAWSKGAYGATCMRFQTDRPGLPEVLPEFCCVTATYEKEIT